MPSQPNNQINHEALLRAEIATIPDHLSWLVKEVMNELNDAEYIHLRHGERHTRNRGCRGPLCKKALRDDMRERVRIINQQKGRTTRQHRRSSLHVEMDPVLSGIKAIHDSEFNSRRLNPEELQTSGSRVA